MHPMPDSVHFFLHQSDLSPVQTLNLISSSCILFSLNCFFCSNSIFQVLFLDLSLSLEIPNLGFPAQLAALLADLFLSSLFSKMRFYSFQNNHVFPLPTTLNFTGGFYFFKLFIIQTSRHFQTVTSALLNKSNLYSRTTAPRCHNYTRECEKTSSTS